MYQPEHSFLHLSHRIAQLAEEAFAKCAPGDGITARQLAILSTIADGDGASQADVVLRTGIDRSTVAEIIGRLVKRRLVSRRRSRHDRRAYVLGLTALGREAVETAGAAADQADVDILSRLPQPDRVAIMRLMQTLCDSPR